MLARLTTVLILAAALAACSGAKPFDYADNNELGKRPGLFTGKDGEFIIFRKP